MPYGKKYCSRIDSKENELIYIYSIMRQDYLCEIMHVDNI
jgi:hypothetical protein